MANKPKASKKPRNDPHADREARKYDNPIPSREYILEELEHSKGPLNEIKLAKKLGLKGAEQIEGLRRRLIAMRRDGQLLFNRRDELVPVSKADLIKGRVIGHRDGFGFLHPEDGSEDLYLSSRQMRSVFDGDEILVREKGLDHRGKREAAVVEVLKRNTTEVVGRYNKESGIAFLRPDNARIAQDILLPKELRKSDVGKPRAGQIVVAKIHQYPDAKQVATGYVTEILGDERAPGMEIDIALRNHDIPHRWPGEVKAAAKALPDEVSDKDKSKRIDIRHLPFVTIDGEDARDFDDAVYCEPTRTGGWKLWVAIADVSHYVEVDSALDIEAHQRGTSVYFPASVIPMLPEKLSNGLCSLKPEVDRLAMVCEMNISAAGKVSRYKFYESVIHSHARLTYTQVGAVLDGDKIAYKELHDVIPQIHNLHGVFKTLLASRKQRGAIEFETQETRIVFGSERKIETIVPVVRNDAHRLIEECMLAANTCAAKLLEKSELPALYRVHEGPTEKKLENLHAFLSELGLSLFGGKKPQPEHYQQILAQCSERPDAHVIQTMLLRSMSQAVYQPENIGHFGLHYPSYAHFTSPIRRYPDLLVHRALRYLIHNSESIHVEKSPGSKTLKQKKIYPYDMAAMLQLGEHCSMTERRADEASRDVVAWLKCEYLQHRIGEQFEGVVNGVASFGLFVELKDIYVEGLVHVSSLQSDYYHYDAHAQRLIGERSSQTYKLGDEVRVELINIDLDERKIDFALLELIGRPGGRIRKRKVQHQKQQDDSLDWLLDEQPGRKPKRASSKRAAHNHSDAERGAHPSKKSRARKAAKKVANKKRPKSKHRKRR